MTGHDFDTDQDTGQAVRTKDGGSAWNELFADADTNRLWQDFAMTSDGVLWGLTLEGPEGGGVYNHMEIWKATDGVGDSWAESKDDSTANQHINTLIAHPRDPKRIAALGSADTGAYRKPKLWFSIDGGDSWNSNELGANLFPAGAYMRSAAIVQLTSNRFVMFNRSSLTAEAWYTSDDNGASWDKRTEITGLTGGVDRILSIVGEAGGARLYSVFIDVSASPSVSKIYESKDGGESWADIGNNVPIPSSSDIGRGGIAYDPIEKALYAFGMGSGRTTNPRHIMKLFPISSTGVWTDVSDTIVPTTSENSYSISGYISHGIAVIPRP